MYMNEEEKTHKKLFCEKCRKHRYSTGKIHHIINKEDYVNHVIAYSSFDTWCSEYDCEYNKGRCICGKTKK